MKRRRRRQRRVRPQKGGIFYNGQLIVNKGINLRSWDKYLQRGSGSKKGGNLHRFANWMNKQEKNLASYHRQKGRKWGRRLSHLFF